MQDLQSESNVSQNCYGQAMPVVLQFPLSSYVQRISAQKVVGYIVISTQRFPSESSLSARDIILQMFGLAQGSVQKLRFVLICKSGKQIWEANLGGKSGRQFREAIQVGNSGRQFGEPILGSHLTEAFLGEHVSQFDTPI